MALVVLPLVTLILGMVEMAAAWKTNSELASASRQGARVVTHLGSDPQADRAALRAVVAGVGGDIGQIDHVIIFDAAVRPLLDGAPCNTGQRCNRYDAADLADLDNNARWGCGGGAHDRVWCPTARSDNPSNLATVGVIVVYRHEYLTRFFGIDDLVLRETTIMKMEPGL